RSRNIVLGLHGVADQRACIWLGNQARDYITEQCTLEGPLEYLALRAVVVDHPKATIAAVIGGVERLMLLSNVGDLAAYNEERTLLDLVKGSGFEPFCLTNAVLKFAANLLEQWPEGLK